MPADVSIKWYHSEAGIPALTKQKQKIYSIHLIPINNATTSIVCNRKSVAVKLI